VAHVLADEALCSSPFALYAWWMVLQLIVETFAAAQGMANAAAAQEATQNSADGRQ
jgi:hypothetical protein